MTASPRQRVLARVYTFDVNDAHDCNTINEADVTADALVLIEGNEDNCAIRTFDGRTDGPLTTEAIFVAWVALAYQLAQHFDPAVHPVPYDICKRVSAQLGIDVTSSSSSSSSSLSSSPPSPPTTTVGLESL